MDDKDLKDSSVDKTTAKQDKTDDIKEPEAGGSAPDVFTSPERDEEQTERDFSTLLDLIHQKKVQGLRAFISTHDPIDIAYMINDMESDADVVFLFKTVPNQYTADIFSYLDQSQQEWIVQAFNSKDVQSFIANMPNDDLADFVEELPSNLVSKVLSSASPDDRKDINALLNYKEETAGSIMTTEYVSIKNIATCDQALAKIKTTGQDAETIIQTYVVNETRKLVGALSLEDLIFAKGEESVTSIMDADCISVVADTDQEDVADLMKKYDLTVIPVIDKEQRMLGIITIDDIMDVIEQEQTEDISKMAAVTPVQNDYLKTSVFKLAWGRIPWLTILLIIDTFSGLLINSYESLLTLVPVLTIFVPSLTDTGGNSGGQTTTVVTRALSLNQISSKDHLKTVFKEFRVSLIVGTFIALVNFGWTYLEFTTHIYTNTSDKPIWQLALLVSVTSFFIIVLSKTIGSLLPLAADRMHIDPAIMAGPLITSIVDTGSLAIYFSIAKLILGIK